MSVSRPQYSITYRGPERLVELTWLPETRGMTDRDFKDGILAFAECALQHSARRLIIDMREFGYRPSSEAQVVRVEVVVPKYVKAGVKKIAWICRYGRFIPNWLGMGRATRRNSPSVSSV